MQGLNFKVRSKPEPSTTHAESAWISCLSQGKVQLENMFAVPQNTYHFEIVLLWHLARGEEKYNMDIKGTPFQFSRFEHRSILL